MTGRVEAAEIVRRDGDVTSVNLDLESYSSEIIVFTKPPWPPAIRLCRWRLHRWQSI